MLDRDLAKLRVGDKIRAAQTGTIGAFAVRLPTVIDRDAEEAAQVLVSAGHVLCEDPFNCSHGPTAVTHDNRQVAAHSGGCGALAVGHDIGFATTSADVETVPLEDGWQTGFPPSGDVADEPYRGAQVWKVGATSGLTRGYIDAESTCLRLDYPNGQTHELSFVVVEGENGEPFSLPGDSGSIVYYRSGEALGVIVAGRVTGRAGPRSYVSLLAPALRRLRLGLTNTGSRGRGL